LRHIGAMLADNLAPPGILQPKPRRPNNRARRSSFYGLSQGRKIRTIA
jgi:hypothetical protein